MQPLMINIIQFNTENSDLPVSILQWSILDLFSLATLCISLCLICKLGMFFQLQKWFIGWFWIPRYMKPQEDVLELTRSESSNNSSCETYCAAIWIVSRMHIRRIRLEIDGFRIDLYDCFCEQLAGFIEHKFALFDVR